MFIFLETFYENENKNSDIYACMSNRRKALLIKHIKTALTDLQIERVRLQKRNLFGGIILQ